MPPSACAGEHSTMSVQPANLAGTPSISTVDGNGALPAGTYRPTRRIGRMMRPQFTPGAVATEKPLAMPALCQRRMRPMASFSARLMSGATAFSAAWNSTSVTASAAGATPSKRLA